MKALGISGSPRRRGNTEMLLDAFLAGAEEAGADCEKIVLCDLEFSSCKGCNACHKTGECIVEDDLTPIFEEILEAGIVALASPIYSMSVTAELKAFIDRGQVFWARKFILKDLFFDEEHTRQHRGVFISTAGQDWDHVFDAAYPVITAFFNDIGFAYRDNITAGNMDGYKGIKAHPTALTEAEERGRKIVGELERV
ncbi:MAG: flavodoxin family protein [Methanocalculus sp. MSAO_Arc1]|uniref:flavodoxin family protein n=1 Tax=Methanocalculus TaxID=71151 RepID=UPI000FEDE60D|nr:MULTISPECIES: flavodoxin family protein [unclassified Methanocalculus]MCP1661495.1 multimeric flavodoxin WrbA [Methanocalculus sp. AMF5]RQD79770.1 MAG: flavodoxin family protein [Methanocalculus sp. MSAO_Arc1]